MFVVRLRFGVRTSSLRRVLVSLLRLGTLTRQPSAPRRMSSCMARVALRLKSPRATPTMACVMVFALAVT